MPPFTRRDFIVSTGATLLSLVSGCGSSIEPGVDSKSRDLNAADFTHGIASGDPLDDAVILWTRAQPALATAASVSVRYVVALDPDMKEIVSEGVVAATAERDWTVKLDLRDLAPDTAYYYRFESASARSPVGRTRTTAVGAVARLRLAFVTCSSYTSGYFHAYRRVADRNDLHAVVHLGDYIYENGRQDQVRPHDPSHEIVTLADYRQRYAQYRSDENLQELHRRHPFIWVWDDHEVANDAWQHGADAHDETVEGPYIDRRRAAMQAAFEWLPIRAPDANDPARVWRSFKFGDLVDLAMIDARHYGREQPLPPNTLFGDVVPVFTQTGEFADPERQILGPAQEAWLAQQLATGSGHWQLIGNQVYFAPLKIIGTPRAVGGGLYQSNDKWDGYDGARARVLEMIRGRSNVVIMTGDAHESYAFEVTDDPNGLGYSGLTGQGSAAVEFVSTSITSRGDQAPGNGPTALFSQITTNAEQALLLTNPHLKYYQNTLNGYVLLDITPERLQAEFWIVPRVTERTDEESLHRAYTVASGSNHLVLAGEATAPMSDAPQPAPAAGVAA